MRVRKRRQEHRQNDQQPITDEEGKRMINKALKKNCTV